jgi:ssDNA-binding Zn-finger/Zn-ribbon topoisomerase 1
MARLYRCTNKSCSTDPHGRRIFDFVTEAKPEAIVCPKCGDAHYLVPLVPVHFLAADPQGPIRSAEGRSRVACRPDMAEVKGRLTGEPSAVTCPACKGTKLFEERQRKLAEVEEEEVEIGKPLDVRGA